MMMTTRRQGTEPILVVEDSPEDFEATTRAFRKAGVENPVIRCEDGDEAINFLFQKDADKSQAASSRPCIILLDLNLPGTDGREVLAEVKANEDLRRIPIVILSTSSDCRDVEACYRLGANSYIRKPVNLARFIETIQLLADYWFDVTTLPVSCEGVRV